MRRPKTYGAIGEFNELLGAGGVVAMRARKKRGRKALVATMSGDHYDPAAALAEKITEALDPSRAPSPVKRFSKAEIAALNEQRKKGGSTSHDR